MLAYFYIPRHSYDMKIAIQKNHLMGQIVYRSLVPSKKDIAGNIYSLFFFVQFFFNVLPSYPFSTFYLLQILQIRTLMRNVKTFFCQNLQNKKREPMILL